LLGWLIGFQILGPSWVWAIQAEGNQAGSSTGGGDAVIVGLGGVVTVTPGADHQPGFAPSYRTHLEAGDSVTTGEESVAELLLKNQGLVVIQEFSEAIVGHSGEGNSQLHLQVGAAELSLPLKGTSHTPLVLSTPNIHLTTAGGLITAEVQPTLGATAMDVLPRKSFVVRTSLRTQSTPPGRVALLETFCVKEGSLHVEYPGSQPGVRERQEIPAEQCVGFFNGALRAVGNEYQIADWRAICAVGQHCEIPDSAKKLIAKKQMGQALALERALVGSGSEEGDVDEQIILATTAANFGGPADASLGSPVQPILPCTNTAQCDINEPPASGGGGGEITPGQNIQVIGALLPPGGIAGGPGLLTLVDGNFVAENELLLADSGFLADAAHLGKAPHNFLAVKELAPEGDDSVSNQRLPLEFASFNQPSTSQVQLGVESSNRQEQAEQLAQFARSTSINPDNIFASVPEGGASVPCQTLLDCFEIILAVGKGGTFSNPDPDSGVDGTIQVRSASTIDPTPGDNRLVTLTKGVVLVNTRVSLTPQQKTQESFSGLNPMLGPPIQSSAVSILGEPGNPALLNIEDRTLAILDGSRIEPANSGVSTALLAVLDGTLRGAITEPLIGKGATGNEVMRQDVPPVIEMIDGDAQVTNGIVVASTAMAGQTSELDQTLLEASSPLIAMIRSTMTTEGDFGRIAGRNAKFEANLMAGDALVRLDASSMMVSGNLFNVSGGGSLLVNGTLVFLNQGSTLNVNGVLVNVIGNGSTFSLTNGALVEFGAGANTLTISNNLCAGGGCFSPFSGNPNWQVSGNSANFSAPAGFNPFLGLGSTQNTVSVGPDSAILSVEGGGAINIQ